MNMATVGPDLARNVLQLHGVDPQGHPGNADLRGRLRGFAAAGPLQHSVFTTAATRDEQWTVAA